MAFGTPAINWGLPHHYRGRVCFPGSWGWCATAHFAAFGATSEIVLYFAAFVIPDFINYMLAGGYFPSRSSRFIRYFRGGRGKGGGGFFRRYPWITLIICAVRSLPSFLPTLAYLAAPGPGDEALAGWRLFAHHPPAQIFFLMGSCVSALLYLRKQFTIPALAPIIYNVFIIGGGFVLRNRGMEGFCWGVLAGSIIGNFLFPLLAAKSGGGFRLRWSFYHPGLKKYFLMALPLMIGKSITIVDEQFVRIFGSLAGVGAISWLNYARRIMLVPVSVVAQAAGVASYPFMADLFVKKDLTRFYGTIKAALQNVLTLLVPLSIWMILVAEPTVRLIFEQGLFGAQDTAQTARLLQVLLLCAA